ncbi:MAG: transglutaminase-like domain-containing protein [Nanobdellota archaeon]
MHQKDLEEDLQAAMNDPEPQPLAGPIKVIGSIIVVLILTLMIVPYYAVHTDPEPDMDFTVQIPELNLEDPHQSIREAMYQETTPAIRDLALQITQNACSHGTTCHAKALFYYVRDEIGYIPDPPYEYIQHPHMTLTGAGDCEDQAILLYHLTRAIGIESHIVTIPGHAYVRIHLQDGPSRYDTVNLDPTCRYCGFDEIPPRNQNKRENVY